MASVYPLLAVSVDLTAPSTNIGTVTPVAVTATVFTASPANNTSAYLASGASLTGANAQSLFDFSQAWNTSGSPSLQTFNITDTASNASSRFVTWNIGTSRKAEVKKNGAFVLYNTFTDASNFESGFMEFGSNHLRIGTGKAGTGQDRRLQLFTGGVLRAQILEDGVYGIQQDTIGFSLNGGGNMPVVSGGNTTGALNFDTAISGNFFFRLVRRTSDPAAAPANNAHIYIKDNGGGKMQLAVRFPTGAVQIVATEP